MSDYQNRQRKQVKLARLEIASDLYKRGYSLRKIQAEVMQRLGLESYSTATVQKDIQTLLAEWKENRLTDTSGAVQLELERIDDAVRELWEQWEKSKRDYTKTSSKRKGRPTQGQGQGQGGQPSENGGLRTVEREEMETEVICLGDVSYLSEIRAQLSERRKLLGLYAPEKKDVTVSEFDLSELTPEQRQVLLQVGENMLNEKE
jgi:hypothetical protein